VFVVGYLGDWRPAAAVLFERNSLQGNPAPSREKRESSAASIRSSPVYGGSDANTADTVTSKWAKGSGGPSGNECGLFVAQPIVLDRAAFNQGENAQYKFRAESSETMDCLVAKGPHAVLQPIPIHDQATRHAGKNGDKTMGKGNGLGIGQPGEPLNTLTKGDRHAVGQPIAFSGQMSNPQTDVEITQTLQAKNPMAVCLGGQHPNAVVGIEQSPTLTNAMGAGGGHVPITNSNTQAIGVDSYNLCETGNLTQTLKSPQGGVTESIGAVRIGMAVRRLTPKECERLQGFPDNYTDIKLKNKPTPDGPRYKALGNSMAVPVMAWIGQRIQKVEDIIK
jgi:DNA (cytosine-5)-methyltransferase 1